MKIYKLLFFVIILFAMNLRTGAAQGYDPRRTISVSGNAEVKVVPDEVVISMSVETNNMILDKAREENDAKVSAILAMSRKFNIEDKLIQTDFLQVEPRYDNQYAPNGSMSERKFLGYYVTKNITITIRDISKFEKFVAEALKLGTNYIGGTSFGTTEIRKYRDQARLDAIRAAKEKAIALAGELGQKIGKPITITEGVAQPYYRTSSMMKNTSRSAAQDNGESAGSIAPGELKIEADVSVTFELE